MFSWPRTSARLWAWKRMRCSFIRRPLGPKQKYIQVCTAGEKAKFISQTWGDLGLVIGWRKLRENCRNRRHGIRRGALQPTTDLRQRTRPIVEYALPLTPTLSLG